MRLRCLRSQVFKEHTAQLNGMALHCVTNLSKEQGNIIPRYSLCNILIYIYIYVSSLPIENQKD